MKKILFLLLFCVAGYGQTSTGQEQEFDYGIKNNSTQTITTPPYLTTTGMDGTQGKIPSTYIAKTAAVQDSLNKKLNLPTGFLYGLQLSINADPTKFDIAAGYYVVTDFTNLANPVVKIITYAGATGLTPAYLATANSTYVALDINGAVVSSASPFTNADRRNLAIVGNVVHSNNTTINVTNEIKAPIVASTNQVHDFMRAIGFLNEEGNIYSPNGANLQINKSAGKIFGMGVNSADYLNPHQLSIPSQTALTFAYRLRGGTQYANTTSIDPNSWDNAGVLTSVPVGNRWTIQRINLFQSGLTRVQYGQTVYTSYNDAITALPTQSFVTEQNIADNAVFRCYLIVQQGTTNLASAVEAGTALFVPVDKFGNVIGNGSVALTYANIVAALGYTPANDTDVIKKNSSGTPQATASIYVDGQIKTNATMTANAIYLVEPTAGGIVSGGGTDKSLRVTNGDTSSYARIFASGHPTTPSVFEIYGSSILMSSPVDFASVSTSAGSYDFLTKNTSTNRLEKISSSSIATKTLTVRKISTNTTLADSDNGTIILLTASCTVTLPNGLMSGFNCSFSTQTGVTMTYALGGSVTLINNTGTTMAQNLSHTIVNTGTSNEYLTAGSL